VRATEITQETMNQDIGNAVNKRVAIAGVGRMGMRHVQAVQALGMRVVAVADQSAAARDNACTVLGLPPHLAFDNGTTMLDTVRPEAAVIATTAPSHAALVQAAAAAGVRHILCEKPMATSLADADAMITACQRHGAVLAVNHQMRFMDQYSKVKALIGSREFGPLSSIMVGGANFGLAMNVCHYFEVLRYLTDSPVRAISAWFDDVQLANPRGPEFQDAAGRLLAWSEAGPTMYIDFAAESGHGLQCLYNCRFGQIAVDELYGDLRVAAREAQYRDLPTTRYGMPAERKSSVIEPVDTVIPTVAVWRAMLSGQQAFPDALAGRHAQACLVAAHASNAAGGSSVRLDDPALDHHRRFPWA
jgi:predicted dehydrogenase